MPIASNNKKKNSKTKRTKKSCPSFKMVTLTLDPYPWPSTLTLDPRFSNAVILPSVCSFWLCRSIVAYPIIYRLVPSPSRFEIRQWDLYLSVIKHSWWRAPLSLHPPLWVWMTLNGLWMAYAPLAPCWIFVMMQISNVFSLNKLKIQADSILT